MPGSKVLRSFYLQFSLFNQAFFLCRSSYKLVILTRWQAALKRSPQIDFMISVWIVLKANKLKEVYLNKPKKVYFTSTKHKQQAKKRKAQEQARVYKDKPGDSQGWIPEGWSIKGDREGNYDLDNLAFMVFSLRSRARAAGLPVFLLIYYPYSRLSRGRINKTSLEYVKIVFAKRIVICLRMHKTSGSDLKKSIKKGENQD